MEYNTELQTEGEIREDSTHQKYGVNSLNFPVVGDVARKLSHQNENFSLLIPCFILEHVVNLESRIIGTDNDSDPESECNHRQQNTDHMEEIESFSCCEDAHHLEYSLERPEYSTKNTVESFTEWSNFFNRAIQHPCEDVFISKLLTTFCHGAEFRQIVDVWEHFENDVDEVDEDG